MRVPTFFALLRRDLRGSRGHLLFFVLSLAVGVGAVVAVASLSAAIDQGVRREARQLLAADLAIVGRQPIPDAMLEAVDGLPGAERVDLREMFTVVALPDDEPQRAPAQVGTTLRSLLVELKSVGVGYPFYGELELEPAGPLRLDAQSVAAEPELLRRLGLTLGDQLRVGGEEFRIVARVLREPDRLTGAFQMGPRLLISTEGLARADLERFGSRVEHRTLIRLPDASPGELTAAVETLEAARPEGEPHRVETWREAQPALRAGLQRSENFLGLAALLSLLIGGIGVAQTVRSWIAGRLNAIAVLTSLGMRRREILSLYLGQTALLGLAASALGVLAGVALVAVARGVLGGSLPVETIDPIQPEVWDRGLALGTGIAVLFALPALSVATRVPPVRVLRRSAEPLGLSPGAQGAFAAVLLGGVFGASWWQARSALYAAWMTGGLALAAGLLALGALALVRVAARPRWQAPLVVRRGLAALAQPSAGTLSAIVALGLGVAVVVTMWRVEAGLSTELGRGLPDDAPSVFLVDIQPDQWPAVEAHLEATGALRIDSAPVVTARLAELDGRPVDELAAERDAVEGEDGRSLRREKRLTYLDTLPEDNTIVAGALWSDPERNEISLDEAFARSMGVRLGSTIVYDVQGILVPVVVTSLRSVDWGTFGLNFFAVVEPGVLDDAPQLRFAAARVPEESVQTLQDTLALETPNVTVIQVLDVIERVRAILGRLAIGIRLLGLLTVVAGLAILAGAVASTTARRGRLVALFKALGMTRRQIAATFAVEYGLIGAVAGLLGTAAGGALAWGILRQALDVEPTFVWWWPAAALATTIALSIGAGLAASVRALERPPIDALRAAD